MRAVPAAAYRLIKDKEQLVLFVYDDGHYPPRPYKVGDPLVGTLTGGWGHTGSDLSIGMTISENQAEIWLEEDLAIAVRRATAKIGDAVVAELTENQWAAIISFVFNCGTGNPDKAEWTIWRYLRSRQFEQVPGQLAKFTNVTVRHPDGTVTTVKSNDLVDRRNAEIGLWAVAEPGTVDQKIPSSVTRANPTPPTPSVAGRSKALITGAVGAVAGSGPTLDRIAHSIGPYAQHSSYVEQALVVLATASAIAAAASLYYIYLNARNARN